MQLTTTLEKTSECWNAKHIYDNLIVLAWQFLNYIKWLLHLLVVGRALQNYYQEYYFEKLITKLKNIYYLCTAIPNENNFLCSWNEIIQFNLLLIFSRNFNSKSFASSNTINSSQVIPCKCCMLARICASFPSSNTWYYVTTIDRSTLS